MSTPSSAAGFLLFLALEAALLVTPMMWPTIPFALGVAVYVLAGVTAIVAVVLWWRGRRGASREQSNGPDAGPGELYIHTDPDIRGKSWKSYIIIWSPTDYFRFLFSDYASFASSIPPQPAKERQLTLYLTNVGPGAVRHVRIGWSLRRVDLRRLIISTGLFGSVLRVIDNDRLQLLGGDQQGAMALPISTAHQTEVAKIDDGETIQLTPGGPFSAAWNIYVLAEARGFNQASKGLRGMFDLMMRGLRHLRPITIELQYVNSSGLHRREFFSVIAWIHANVATPAKTPNAKGHYYTDAEGTTAWVDHLQVTRGKAK